MGLTHSSAKNGFACIADIDINADTAHVITLAGNPNVGKSTVFNCLTGLKQHTGNWTGKTVSNAVGEFAYENERYILVDVPGTYSLMTSSADEEAARDFICFGNAECCVIVADATCLERNLNLVLQISELNTKAILCVNLIDEAKKKGIEIDLDELSLQLGMPCVAAAARSKKGMDALCREISAICKSDSRLYRARTEYDEIIEKAVKKLSPAIEKLDLPLDTRFTALKLLDSEETFRAALNRYTGFDLWESNEIKEKLDGITADFKNEGLSGDDIRDMITTAIVQRAENIAKYSVRFKTDNYSRRDRILDRLFTSRLTGIPIMLMMFGIIFWLTVTGANYPSALLSKLFNKLGAELSGFLLDTSLPLWVEGLFIQGIYKTLTWVISVMLPPMAIFFPLFTLLEDLGYLPRVAFNTDKVFRKCGANGKQSLTMCMGLGCNACGVTGARIISSPKERLIAILTNSLVPCNGRFPTLIAIITMFLCTAAGIKGSVISAVILLFVIILAVTATLMMSKLLSKTVLKGMPSSFVLELPPYRPPQIGKVIIRSVFDRTLFVLGRAVTVAIPAGAVIWLLANVSTGGIPLLTRLSDFLDPFARFIGLDGVILLAFMLGLPANEIVFPIIIMAYMQTGVLTETSDLSLLRGLLVDNGWTVTTAICTMLFCLFHFPCSTTCLTIYKETGSIKWTAVSVLMPTLVGTAVCAAVANISKLISIII